MQLRRFPENNFPFSQKIGILFLKSLLENAKSELFKKPLEKFLKGLMLRTQHRSFQKLFKRILHYVGLNTDDKR